MESEGRRPGMMPSYTAVEARGVPSAREHPVHPGLDDGIHAADAVQCTPLDLVNGKTRTTHPTTGAHAMDIDKALATQLANIEKRTGKSLDALSAIVRDSGLAKHGELVAMLKRDLGMGHGDANTLVHFAKRPAEPLVPAGNDPLDDIYTGPKAGLRPIHERLLERINAFGPFEVAPKKGYVSLRRKKQFATVGPATKSEVEIGLNAKDERVGAPFVRLPPGGMCQFKVRLDSVDAIDAKLLAALRIAYDEAG